VYWLLVSSAYWLLVELATILQSAAASTPI
jgi:hypothetical protein